MKVALWSSISIALSRKHSDNLLVALHARQVNTSFLHGKKKGQSLDQNLYISISFFTRAEALHTREASCKKKLTAESLHTCFEAIKNMFHTVYLHTHTEQVCGDTHSKVRT